MLRDTIFLDPLGGGGGSGMDLHVGLLSDRPPFGVYARVYYCTDTTETYLDIGTKWIMMNESDPDIDDGGVFL